MASRIFRCSICDSVSDQSLVSHNKYDKGHYYEDPKYPKESFICDDCYLSVSETIVEFEMSDDYGDLKFNPSLKRRK